MVEEEQSAVLMEGYTVDLLEMRGTFKCANTPALEDLFIIDTSSVMLADKERTSYHSVAAKAYYILLSA